jgi:hypothetical protein
MADEVKRCHQCGRVGTRQFVPWPDRDVEYSGEVVMRAGEFWECSNKRACRGRWPKRRWCDD